MPLYDYKCDKCQRVFEAIVKKDTDIIFCNKCGHTSKIVFHPVCNFHLKGKGWSKDGYNKKKSALDKSVVY